MLLLYIYRCTCKEIHIRKESICNRMESVMKAVLLTRTVVKLGFFIDISFDLKNIVNHDEAWFELSSYSRAGCQW